MILIWYCILPNITGNTNYKPTLPLPPRSGVSLFKTRVRFLTIRHSGFGAQTRRLLDGSNFPRRCTHQWLCSGSNDGVPETEVALHLFSFDRQSNHRRHQKLVDDRTHNEKSEPVTKQTLTNTVGARTRSDFEWLVAVGFRMVFCFRIVVFSHVIFHGDTIPGPLVPWS